MTDATPSFQPVLAAATLRAGGPEALEALLPRPKTAEELIALPDDRYLSEMSRRIFRAGLRHALVDERWPAFEEVFHGFEPFAVRAMRDEELEALMNDARIIRHWAKIKSVRENAAAMIAVAERAGSFGAYLAGWPTSDVIGLWRALARDFVQMGGNSGPAFLRMVGKDTFLLTGDVVAALIGLGVVARPPKTVAERRTVQAAFNAWSAETGRPLAALSRMLALSVG